MNIASAIETNLVIDEIDRTHRVGKLEPSSTKPRDIIIKFTSFRARQKMMRNKAKLKVMNHKSVFLNEDLTLIRNKVFYLARILVREKKLEGAWTTDGVILAKDGKQKVHRLESQHDLDLLVASW